MPAGPMCMHTSMYHATAEHTACSYARARMQQSHHRISSSRTLDGVVQVDGFAAALQPHARGGKQPAQRVCNAPRRP